MKHIVEKDGHVCIGKSGYEGIWAKDPNQHWINISSIIHQDNLFYMMAKPIGAVSHNIHAVGDDDEVEYADGEKRKKKSTHQTLAHQQNMKNMQKPCHQKEFHHQTCQHKLNVMNMN